ncbi:putative HTH-type transcriptional regulator ImmR [Brochothrix thermosphacta]|uniref:helix-turn-helix domain-containing protein n=1 Tax=Brochothrix thermosphacta TaxID=2756 RepID=UPI000D778324|nr:helix-turn-helix transcriptional regulator [Brochothrix thermosphacta]SPN70989.1 putative HTH-type transcriptional regulator ImmR [Brochothrix thermosphacta]
MNVKNRLKYLRTKNGLSLKELSTELNIPYNTLRNYELGERNPSIDKWETIAAFFHVDVGYIMGTSTYRNKAEYFFSEKSLEKIYNLTQNKAENARDVRELIPIFSSLLETASEDSIFQKEFRNILYCIFCLSDTNELINSETGEELTRKEYASGLLELNNSLNNSAYLIVNNAMNSLKEN